MNGENVGGTQSPAESCPHQSKLGTGADLAGVGGHPYLLGGGGLISVAHWQVCLCTGHAGISSQLFYIMKICMLGKFQGTAAINLLHSLQAKQGPCRTDSLPPCRKGGSGSPVRAPFRGTPPWGRVEWKYPTWPSIHPKEGAKEGPQKQKGTQSMKKKRYSPLYK